MSMKLRMDKGSVRKYNSILLYSHITLVIMFTMLVGLSSAIQLKRYDFLSLVVAVLCTFMLYQAANVIEWVRFGKYRPFESAGVRNFKVFGNALLVISFMGLILLTRTYPEFKAPIYLSMALSLAFAFLRALVLEPMSVGVNATVKSFILNRLIVAVLYGVFGALVPLAFTEATFQPLTVFVMMYEALLIFIGGILWSVDLLPSHLVKQLNTQQFAHSMMLMCFVLMALTIIASIFGLIHKSYLILLILPFFGQLIVRGLWMDWRERSKKLWGYVMVIFILMVVIQVYFLAFPT